jgi:hypothetical protein
VPVRLRQEAKEVPAEARLMPPDDWKSDARSKCGKRIGVDPTTSCDLQYADDEREFLQAMAAYQKRFKRRFPTLKETLDVLKSLGYRKESKA